tara:strand:- start:197 stop:424 length:228 start_codon:yes stop_codon:yes gene_type:complete
MRPSSYTMQHLQQGNNIRPMSGELSGVFGGTGTFSGLTALAVAGVAYAFIKKEDWAPLAGAFLAGHIVGGGSLYI